ncbi:hypothetical protein [Thalassospira xiamenensis]|nr:hypothetical protein [Thalassospira xiamenensis]MCK2169070.1 hypothetical protein [Thalassospira xiamenensis]
MHHRVLLDINPSVVAGAFDMPYPGNGTVLVPDGHIVNLIDAIEFKLVL